MSEQARLGEVLSEVMSDITKRMDARCSILVAIAAEKAILDARSNIKNRESRNDPFDCAQGHPERLKGVEG